jgi:fucose permease
MSQSDRLLVVIAFLGMFTIGLTAGLMGVAWPSMRDTFGVGDDAYGALSLIATAGALAVTFNSGRLIARIGTGPLLAISGLVGALGFLGYTLAPSWPVLVALGLAASLGTAAIAPGLNTYFAVHQSAGRITWLNACFGLGATISPVFLTAILNAGRSWRWGYALAAVAYVLLAAVFALTRRRWPQPEATDKGEKGATIVSPPATSRHTLALPAVWLSLLLFFTFTGMEASTAQWTYTLFTEGRGIAPAVAGAWASAFWASVTVGRITIGAVVDRRNAGALVRACMAGAVVGAAAIWLGAPPWLGFAGVALTGLGLSPLFPVLTSTTPQRLGAARAADAIGYQMAAVRLGLAAVPALAGVLSERVGVGSIGPFLFVTAVAMVALNEGVGRMTANGWASG